MIEFRVYSGEYYTAVKQLLQDNKMYDEVWDSRSNFCDISHNPDHLILAFEEDQLVGFAVMIKYATDLVFLFRLVVKSEYQNRGIGTAILIEAETRARKLGFKELGLYVDSYSEKLINYYNRKGFKTSGKDWKYMYKSFQT